MSERELYHRVSDAVKRYAAEPDPKIPVDEFFSTSRVLRFIQARDFLLARTKKRQLEPVIEAVVEEIRGVLDSDEVSTQSSELMEVKDTNAMNKQTIGLWASASKSRYRPDAGGGDSAQDTETGIINAKRKTDKPAEKELAKKKQKTDRSPPSNLKLAHLGGIDDILEEVLELIAMPMKHPEVYVHTGVQPPRGVLLHGPPGCGKTLLANAIAGELELPFISISAPSVVSGMSGESEKKIREIFEEARSLAPCLLFFDEIDAVTPKRESAQREMERRIVAQLLTCMDDLSLESTNGQPVIIIGATNRPDALDAALRRAGRFDREICLNVPDEEGRERILQVLSKNLRLFGDFDFQTIAKMTPGFVGADLNALTTAAGVAAIKRIFAQIRKSTQVDSMEVDSHSLLDSRSNIKQFLDAHPETLSESQMAPLAITLDDFLAALPKIQPSSKREGFATVPDVVWADIGALSAVREELIMAIVQPIKYPQFFAKVGVTAPIGVLLWGPPGCGKTLLAKAVANESKANFISIRGPELLNKYVGESERAVRQVFLRARASAPCIIFFDELDALVPRRDDSLSESSARLVNMLLTELDGLSDRKGVFVIAATNRPDMIDPAMLRPGRLDKPLFVALPTESERHEILKTVTKQSPLMEDVNLVTIAADPRCENFSGADLAALAREAAMQAIRAASLTANLEESMDEGMSLRITVANFDSAFSKVSPSVNKRDRERYLTLGRRYGWDNASPDA